MFRAGGILRTVIPRDRGAFCRVQYHSSGGPCHADGPFYAVTLRNFRRFIPSLPLSRRPLDPSTLLFYAAFQGSILGEPSTHTAGSERTRDILELRTIRYRRFSYRCPLYPDSRRGVGVPWTPTALAAAREGRSRRAFDTSSPAEHKPPSPKPGARSQEPETRNLSRLGCSGPPRERGRRREPASSPGERPVCRAPPPAAPHARSGRTDRPWPGQAAGSRGPVPPRP